MRSGFAYDTSWHLKFGAFALIHQNQLIMHVKCYVAHNVTDKVQTYSYACTRLNTVKVKMNLPDVIIQS